MGRSRPDQIWCQTSPNTPPSHTTTCQCNAVLYVRRTWKLAIYFTPVYNEQTRHTCIISVANVCIAYRIWLSTFWMWPNACIRGGTCSKNGHEPHKLDTPSITRSKAFSRSHTHVHKVINYIMCITVSMKELPSETTLTVMWHILGKVQNSISAQMMEFPAHCSSMALQAWDDLWYVSVCGPLHNQSH